MFFIVIFKLVFLSLSLTSSFHNVDSVVTLEPSTDCEAKTFINGTEVTELTELHHVRPQSNIHHL